MMPLGTLTAGLEAIGAWLMSVLAVLALLVSVIVCVAIGEFILARGALSRAYTVKINPSESDCSSGADGKPI